MGQNDFGRLVRGALLGTACLSAFHAADARAQEVEDQSEIVVTGSRIARSGFSAPTPTTMLGAEELQVSAATNLADVVNTLPAVKPTLTPASASNNSNFGSGNYLDLRGIGPARTLVLVDRKRFVPSSIYGFVDVNVVPQALVRQVEVVTGGASAAWGSDAVAGVVNFQLDHALEGFRATIQGETTEHNDHQGYLTSFAYGAGFAGGRGHVLLAAEFAENSGVLRQDSRDWGAQGYRLITNPAYTPSNDEPMRLIAADVRTANASYGGLITSGPLRGIQFGAGSVPLPFNFGTALTATTMIGGDGVRSNANAVLETPLERQSVFARASFDFSSSLTGYVEASYGHSSSEYPLALPGVNIDTVTIRIDNAFLPASVRDAMAANSLTSFTMGRYSDDYAMVQAELSTEVRRFVAGLEGQFGGGWSWDAYYTYGQSNVDIVGRNNRITANYNLAVDAVAHPTSGAIVCRSTLTDPTNGCVPVNLFGAGSVSDEARAYMMGTAVRSWNLQQNAAAFTLRGDPFSTWAGVVSFAGGIEARRDSADVTADPLSAASRFGIGAQIPWSGEVDVWETFGELVVPLAADAPFAHALDLNLGARYTDYSTSGGVSTWKVGLTYDITESLRLRTTRSRDIRAPALAELFQGASQVNSNVIDPTTSTSVNVRSPVLGNANLEPEEGDTFTFGVVYRPAFLPGLRLSADYYDINIEGAITSLTAQAIVDRCAAGNTQACNSVTRVGGVLTQVDVVPMNLQSLEVRGIDFEADYRIALDEVLAGAVGDFGLRALVTYTDTFDLTDNNRTTSLAGSTEQPVIQGIGGVPHWRHSVRASYFNDPLSLHLTARYIGGGNISNAYTEKDINILEHDGRWYFDLSVQYELLADDERSAQLFFAVENLLDRDPPIVGGGFNTSATVRSLYDQIGRVFTAGVRLKY